MRKGKIIALSIISAVAITIIVLFSSVFCLYNEEVKFNDEVSVTKEEIVSASGLKHGTPIFSINKETATSNIERSFPTLKVEAIKTKSVRTIEFVISKRFPLFYIAGDENYILDEDLKIIAKGGSTNDLIKLDLDLTNLEYEEGEFIFKNYRDTLKNFYISAYRYIKLPMETEEYRYLEREELCAFISRVGINDITGEMTIELNNAFKIYIQSPSIKIDEKINLAFSTYNALYEREKAAGRLEQMADKYSIIVTYNKNGDTIVGIHNSD